MNEYRFLSYIFVVPWLRHMFGDIQIFWNNFRRDICPLCVWACVRACECVCVCVFVYFHDVGFFMNSWLVFLNLQLI